jgi:signal transduction histidine kinase
MRTFRLNLTATILAFLSCLLLLTWLLFSVLAFNTAASDLYAQKGEHARMLLATFVSQLPDDLPTFPNAVLPGDSPAAVYAQKLAEEPSFVRLSLLDINGKPIYSAGRDGAGDVYRPFSVKTRKRAGSLVTEDGEGIIHIVQVMRNGAVAGSAGLILTLAAEKERLQRSRQILLIYFVITFVALVGGGSFVLARIVVRPINRLLSATERIIGGQYGQQVPVSGSAELARLGDSFNAMSTFLQLKEQEVGEHVAALEQANRELRLAREEAIRTEKMASIGLLAAGMAHEIGTPLAAIMGYAELAASEQLDAATVQDYARRISGDCARIDRIVRGLLDYSRPRPATEVSCDLNDLVESTVDMLTQQGAFKGIELATDIGDKLPAACVDPHQLQQVLINLLLNSRDAMPSGGKLAITVKVDNTVDDSKREASRLRIDVLDTGCGIPAASQSRIFDPFFTTKPPGKGTGLGLAISARIIEGFGGSITVQSQEGAGTCFTLRLPGVSA